LWLFVSVLCFRIQYDFCGMEDKNCLGPTSKDYMDWVEGVSWLKEYGSVGEHG